VAAATFAVTAIVAAAATATTAAAAAAAAIDRVGRHREAVIAVNHFLLWRCWQMS